MSSNKLCGDVLVKSVIVEADLPIESVAGLSTFLRDTTYKPSGHLSNKVLTERQNLTEPSHSYGS